MEHTPTRQKGAQKAPKRQMISLRMSAFEIQECREFAALENRSASQFSYLMYLRGLEAWKAERTARPARRR